MKKTLALIFLFLSVTLGLHAQDARQRTVETVVADVLAAMPAQNSADFRTQMTDLAAAAPESIVQIAALLKPAAEGVRNNLYEYALSGVVNFVSDPSSRDRADAVLEGIRRAVSACADPTNKAFLTSLERMLLPAAKLPEAKTLSVKEAKALLKSPVSGDRCAAAEALMKSNPAKALKFVSSALKSTDGQYRNAVLSDATDLLGTGSLVPLLMKRFPKLSDGAKLDVLNWFGNNKIHAATDLVLGAFGTGGDLSKAAIAAAGKIGGAGVAKALVSQLGGNDAANSAAAMTALKSFNGNIRDEILQALSGSEQVNAVPLFALASERRLTEAAPIAFERLSSGETEIAKHLTGLVGPGDIQKLADLIDGVKLDGNQDIKPLVNAFDAAQRTLSPDKRYEVISEIISTAKHKEYFFPSLGRTGTDKAVEDLSKAFADENLRDAAFDGLMQADNYSAAAALLDIAKLSGKEQVDRILPRYADLVDRFEADPAKARFLLSQALDLPQSVAVKNHLLTVLGRIPTMKAFLLAGKYLDNEGSARAAANAVKNIASKTQEEINYSDFKSILDKAQSVLRATGDADDGYSADEIDKMLTEAQPSPISRLTPEEEKQGFEMLFDGTDLDKWQGDKEGYTPVNGAIYVSADYGASGNLYTKKEYRNFVFRFEFCFLREGINNGVGVRTPTGVDAAYDGMCEVQILDHDAPMYANLRDYQVHGSVYGIIPTKRIVHKPLGEWGTQEIRVEGDNIKVTVNGEVIVDGNIRKACKGHNVAPDGSDVNPYTVDRRNHPGLFNKQGYISFCGHGEGLKIRNVRILDLGGDI